MKLCLLAKNTVAEYSLLFKYAKIKKNTTEPRATENHLNYKGSDW